MANKFTFLIIVFFIFISFVCNSEGVVINEFMSANSAIIQDEDGDYSDWIELYNNSDSNINLKDYGISDDEDEPLKWRFPDVMINAKGFLLVFTSGKDRKTGQYLHTDFSISSGGENLLLTNSKAERIDIINSLSLQTDMSYGRMPDGSDNFLCFIYPSPGKTNNTNSNSTINFSNPSGFYTNTFNLSINSTDSVYYTLNGSVPTKKSLIYKTPIPLIYKTNQPNSLSTIKTGYSDYFLPKQNVFKANVVRAVAYKNGKPSSPVVTNTYLVDKNMYSRYNLPVVSLVTDSLNFFSNDTGIYIPGKYFDVNNPKGSGNYFMVGPEWERDVHFDLFNLGGTSVCSQDAGVRTHGASSMKLHQKSLRLYAREEYGSKYFNYPLFPERDNNQYKRFLLRTAYSGTIFLDLMCQDFVRSLNFESQSGYPAIVLVNGEYWGIQMVTERIDKYYLSEKYNISPDSLNLLERANGDVIDGSNTDYVAMINFLHNNNISRKENYNFIKGQMDIDNYIDYQIAEIFLNNYDWPSNNIKFWKPKKAGSKWKWLLYDMDYALGQNGVDYNMLNHATAIGGVGWPNSDASTFLFRTLLLNEEFKNQFVSRFDALLNTTFLTDNFNNYINKYIHLLETDVPEHINRWHNPSSVSEWLSNLQAQFFDFAKERPYYMRKQLAEKFGLDTIFKLTILINDSNRGKISVNNAPCNFNKNIFEGNYFGNRAIVIKAKPVEGCKLSGWTGIQGGDSIVVFLDKDSSITANFIKKLPITNLYINEFMADNKSVIDDEFNEYDDWIELYNAGVDTVNLAGLYITDDLKFPCKWQFPSPNYKDQLSSFNLLNIAPKKFKVIWADGQPEQGPLHVNIKLSALGEQIGLYQKIENDTLMIDNIFFGAQTTDQSFGRYPDGVGIYVNFHKPTPGASNINTSVSNFSRVLNFGNVIINPNPTNQLLDIRFQLTKNSLVNIDVYDIQGRIVRNLLNKNMTAGKHNLSWDLTDNNNSKVSEGIFYVKFIQEDFNFVKKLIVLK